MTRRNVNLQLVYFLQKDLHNYMFLKRTMQLANMSPEEIQPISSKDISKYSATTKLHVINGHGDV